APPTGRTSPSKASSGSSVGFPSLEIAHPIGIFCLFLAAKIILPLATTLVAVSKIIFFLLSPVGIPYEKGLVPKKRSRPPPGAIFGGAFVVAKAIQLFSAAY